MPELMFIESKVQISVIVYIHVVFLNGNVP